MRTMILAILALMFQVANADKLKDYEAALVAGNYSSAKSIHDSMYFDRNYTDTPFAKDLPGLSLLIYQFQYADEYEQAYRRYMDSRTAESLNGLRGVYSSWVSNGPGEYAVSQPTVDLLNKKKSTARSQMAELNAAVADQERVESERKRIESERIAAEGEAKRLAAKEAFDKEMRLQEEQAARESAAAEAALAARKKECGADYGKPEVGMALSRAQRCINGLRLVGQLNRTDGVVSQYRAGWLYLNVMGGRIVSWNRL